MSYKPLITLLLVYPLVSETILLAARVSAEILPTAPVTLLAEKTDSAPPSRGAPSSGRRGAGVPFMEFPTDTMEFPTDTIESYQSYLRLLNIFGDKQYYIRCLDGDVPCDSSQSYPKDSYKYYSSIYDWGFQLYRFGRLQDALNSFNQALEIAPSKEERAIFFNIIAIIYDELGKDMKALEYFNQSLVVSQENSDLSSTVLTLKNIATLYFRQGEKQKTLEYFDRALALIREIGDRSGEGITLNNIGEVYRSLGENAKAREYYQQALAIFQKLGDTKRAETVNDNFSAAR